MLNLRLVKSSEQGIFENFCPNLRLFKKRFEEEEEEEEEEDEKKDRRRKQSAMAGPPDRSPINIAASTAKVPIDSRLPLSKYYRMAGNLLKQVKSGSSNPEEHGEGEKTLNLIRMNLKCSVFDIKTW
jgi:hypothetical protein